MNTDDFDAMLNVNDPFFKDKLYAALGIKEGDTVEIVTPQFERTDGVVPCIPDAWESLRSMSINTLQSIGCGRWDEPNENGTLMLFPYQWYPHIPEGYMMECISGEIEPFKNGETDDDYRFGCLAYGIRVKEHSNG